MWSQGECLHIPSGHRNHTFDRLNLCSTLCVEPWGLRPLKPPPAPSKLRLRRVEFMLHALRGAMGIRTPDLLNAIEALYQLSYDPETSNLIAAFSVSQGKPLACGVSSG